MPYGCLLEEHSAQQERRTEGVAKKVSCPRMVHGCGISILFLSPTAFLVEFAKRGPKFKETLFCSSYPSGYQLGVKARQTRGSRELNESFVESRSSSWCVFICFLGRRTCCGKNINLQLLEIWLSSWSSKRVTKANRLLMPFLRSWNNPKKILFA